MSHTGRDTFALTGATTGAPRGQSGPWVKAVHVLLAFVGVLVCLVWAGWTLGSGSASDSEAVTASNRDALWVWVSLLGFATGPLLHVVVHELGHLLAAVALRLPVLGVRIGRFSFGRPDEMIAGTSGHVRVELAAGMAWLPLRMSLFALAGSAANVAVATAIATTVVADPSAPTGLRTFAVGVAVAGYYFAIMSLVPSRPAHDHESDGLQILLWILRPRQEAVRAVPQTPRGRPSEMIALAGTSTIPDRREELVAAIREGHPDVAVAAMAKLLGRRPRWDDGWQDLQVVETFVRRGDLAADIRAKVGSQYALSLATAHLVASPPGAWTEPHSTLVSGMEHLAETALVLDEQALQARTAVALVRVIQGRSSEAQGLLDEGGSSASTAVQARAYAVRGIAELELGDLDQAEALASQARRNAIDDPVVKLLHRLLAAKAAG